MNRHRFLKMEQEAFKEAQEQGFSDVQLEPPEPISKETIQNFRSMEETNFGLWAGLRGEVAAKKLIKAAKIKHPKRYLGILTDKKPDIVEGITPDGIIEV